jgi:tricarballylate dehydrogenase
MTGEYDVIVIGAGNAALCAAVAAGEAGACVLVLERAPYSERGGNTAYTGGSFRVVYQGAEDIVQLVPDLSREQLAQTDFGSYTELDFYEDMARVTESRTDPDLCATLITQSFGTLRWLTEQGVRLIPKYGRQAYKVDDKFRFWGGLAVEVSGGGVGLIDSLAKTAAKLGTRTLYDARATELIVDDLRVTGVRYQHNGSVRAAHAPSVVLACGGFEANAEWRTRYLGPGWDLVKVRGSRYDTGDGLAMALAIGAMPWGNWSGAHADPYGVTAPDFGQREVGDAYQKHSYPFGIMVNANGERFVDEGADFRNYTYAKYGRVILSQPGQFAYQVFDQKAVALLRDQYRARETAKVSGDTIEELAARLEGVNPERFVHTVREYNSAIRAGIPFNPNIKDGRSTSGLAIEKSNWATELDTPPYEAYQVTCGITFTFGGLKISRRAEVLDAAERPIPGLYACGEIVGGLFYFNYPGGAGLMSGAVFGRIAGTNAAAGI